MECEERKAWQAHQVVKERWDQLGHPGPEEIPDRKESLETREYAGRREFSDLQELKELEARSGSQG